MNIGLGFDIHRIRPVKKGGYLLAAGVKIPAPYRVEAHSDGDLVYHAVSDALASALSLPDIGNFFPSGKRETKAMASAAILEHYLRAMRQKKATLLSVSVVIVAEKPKLDSHRERMQQALAKALHLDSVGIIFKTFEEIEPLAGKSVVCWANCLVG